MLLEKEMFVPGKGQALACCFTLWEMPDIFRKSRMVQWIPWQSARYISILNHIHSGLAIATEEKSKVTDSLGFTVSGVAQEEADSGARWKVRVAPKL